MSRPDGTNARGHANVQFMPNSQLGFPQAFVYGGHVTCLTVRGNRAAVGFAIENSTVPDFPPLSEGRGFLLFVEDNGPPQNGQSVDFVQGQALPTPPEQCPEPNFKPVSATDTGNHVVHDAVED